MDDLELHFRVGFALCGVFTFRLLWGFVGSYHSRFFNFIWNTEKLAADLKALFSRAAHADTEPAHGHSASGSWASVAILSLIAFQLSSGLFANDEEYFFGPLSHLLSDALASQVTELHHLGVNLLLGLLAVHISAALFYDLHHKMRLIPSMLHGRKNIEIPAESLSASSHMKNELPTNKHHQHRDMSLSKRAGVVLLLSASLSFYLIKSFG